jgi:hypothetical protein
MIRSFLVLSVFISGVAFTTPSFQELGSQAVNQALAHRNLPVATPTSCTDFSGTWVGSCSVGGERKDETLVITQKGCDTIQMGSQVNLIGGLESVNVSAVTSAGKPFAVTGAASMDWNKNYTELKTEFNAIVKAIGVPGQMSFAGNGLTRIDGGKLLIDLEILGIKASCSYDKK